MKNNILVVLMILLPFAKSIAQEQPTIKRFHLELSGGLAVPQGLREQGLDGGILIAIEPRYVVSRQLKIGLKMESALLMSNFLGEGDGSNEPKGQYGYLLTADYLFQKKKLQPYAGMGIGIHTVSKEAYNNVTTFPEEADALAVMIRTGFEFGDNRYRAGMEYHFVGPVSFSDRNKYFSIKLGLLLFSRKRHK